MNGLYKKLFKYVPKEKYLAHIGICLSVISVILTVLAYYYFYIFLNQLIVEDELLEAKYYAFLITGLLIVGYALGMGSCMLTHVLGFRLETNLRKKGIDGILSASFKYFDLNSSGKIRKIIDDNAAQTHMIVAHLIPDTAGAVITPFCVIAIGFFVSLRVGIILLILTLFTMVTVKFMMGNKTFLKIYQESLERLSGETVEYVRGIQVIKIFGVKIKAFKALHDAIISYSKNALEYSFSCRVPYVIYQGLFLCLIPVMVVIYIFFTDMNPTGKIAVELIMLLFLGGVLFLASMRIMYLSMYAFTGQSVVDKLESTFDEMQQDRLQFGNKNHFENFNIEFSNVTFGYGNERIFENLSFKLEENKRYALVGESGSGKSTIAKLMSGFYKVDSGEIKIGRENIQNYSEEAVMKNIAFVFQNTQLFKNSIYENVKIGNPQASREEILKALSLACCDGILDKFETRENTIIGSKGVFLSGGEKQRIAIARAILKNANIIILDEASASLDPENEHELQKAFFNLAKGKTLIMIAHRLTSIKNVDEILVMENGRIIERGSDKELMEKDTKYKAFQDLYGVANEWRLGYENMA